MDIRVADFVRDHKNDKKEIADTHTFYDEFFRIFGKERREVSIFETAVKKFDAKPGDHPDKIDLFWPSVLLVEQKSADKTIKEADEQADKYCLNLQKNRNDVLPRYILTSNFHTFHLRDLESKKDWTFKIEELPKKLDLFGFMTEGVKTEFEYEESVSMKASNIMTNIFKQLEESGYEKKYMEPFLARLTYCFFADDTGIFPTPHMFQKYITDITDVSNIGPKIVHLFDNLDKEIDQREKLLDDDIKKFPYVNGGLFNAHIKPPSFDEKMRDDLINASKYDWSDISPMIFGSLFQNVMSDDALHEHGAHYTTEENILKVLLPMFLRKLWGEFTDIKNLKHGGKKKKLEKFQEKLSQLKFFDPACGSGNFLTITYRELRRLEMEVISEIHDKEDKRLDVTILSKISINQFYGIEMFPFPVKIAQTALWMMEHLMNKELAAKFGDVYVQLPLITQPNIQCGDALEYDWNKVLDPNECSYVLGNPPFGGAKKQSSEQREQVRKIAKLGKGGGTLDYVSAWFIKAGQYVNDNTTIGFVATDSITQGEQVGQLWHGLLDEYKLNIIFAYTPFKWFSETKRAAQVTVVIIGLSKKNITDKTIFTGKPDMPNETSHAYISPNLVGFNKRFPIVDESSNPLNGLPKMIMGSKPIDFKQYIFNDKQKNEFLKIEPDAEKFLRPYINAKDFLNDRHRWILALQKATPAELKKMPQVRKRMEIVRECRRKSTDAETRKLGDTPAQYHLNVIPTERFLIIPRVTSKNRKYVPLGYAEPPFIPSDATMIIIDAGVDLFGLLTSKMHMIWLNIIGGKLKLDYRYSAGMVYNTFPTPEKYDSLEPYGQKILDVRAKYPDSSLDDLYDAVTMRLDLQTAHNNLDRAVDKLYRKAPFKDDHERLVFLLEKYQKMITHTDCGPGIGGVD